MERDFNYGYLNIIGWNSSGEYGQIPFNSLYEEPPTYFFDYVLFLKFDNGASYTIPDLKTLINGLIPIFQNAKSSFVILTPRKDPPLYTASEDEFVYSFCCSMTLINTLLHTIGDKSRIGTAQLLFEVFDALTKSDLDLHVVVKEIPLQRSFHAIDINADVIMPHKGDNDYLLTALRSFKHLLHISTYVGIDQPKDEFISQITIDFPLINFYQFEPNPVGPYVIRNRLIDYSRQNLKFFHDSDDISCMDRFAIITEYMRNTGCDLCGSYELRFDYLLRNIQAVRFPLDVLASLKSGPWHSLLHPSSAITTTAFYKCGSLSEDRIFANDTKFLLNSYFYLTNIRNVDAFLYIRRKHPASLTNSENTKIGSPIRQKLINAWCSDFEKVKLGTLDLNKSGLGFISTSVNVKVRKLISL